jgi:hypothetical protein
MDLSLFDIALMPIIVAVVEAIKGFGMPTKWAPLLTGVLAVGGYVLSQQIELNPAIAPAVQYGFNILLVFLGTTGVYAIGKFTLKQIRGKPGSAASYRAAVEDLPDQRG